MEEVSEGTSTQFSENAAKRNVFFFFRRKGMYYLPNLFLFRSNPCGCNNFYSFLDDPLVVVCDLQRTIVGKSIFFTFR